VSIGFAHYPFARLRAVKKYFPYFNRQNPLEVDSTEQPAQPINILQTWKEVAGE